MMLDPAFSTNRLLTERLRCLVEAGAPEVAPMNVADVEFEVYAAPGASREAHTVVDVVITANEVNDKHGTGPLVKRIFGERENVFSIRSKNDWGDHEFGAWSVCVPQRERPRPECYRRALAALGNRRVGQVLCIPFLSDEIITAIAVHDGFDARLGNWLMDDQNVAASNLTDELLAEYLEKCSVRFFTHAELRDAYERKFGLKSYVLPAVVPHSLVAPEFVPPPTETGRGALIGSFWDQLWFDRSCDALAGCGANIDWYGNNESPWLTFPPDALERAGVTAMGLFPEQELVRRLRQYPYVVVPVGTLEKKEQNTGVARLSLPGRILFAVASAHTPILIIGSEETCGARFVKHFDLGEVVPYAGDAVSEAIARITAPDRQMELRRNAAAIAERLSAKGINDWVRVSIDAGRPADDRFEDLFAGLDTSAALEPLDIQPYRR